jgi:hypothetical protein
VRSGASPRAIGLLAAAVAGLIATALPGRAQAQDGAPEAPAPEAPTPDVPPPEAPAPDPPPGPASLEDLVEVFDDKNRVPENPAIDILDADGLNAVKPGSIKDVATDLRALYVGGKVVPQIAVELAPYVLLYGRRTSYDDYRRHRYVSILHRLSISLATTSIGDGDAAATLAAVGVRVRLYDRSDWRLDREAVSCALDAVELAKPPAKPGTGIVVVEDAPSPAEVKRIKTCFDKAKKRNGSWNAEQLALGAALSSAFPAGKLAADVRDLTAWVAWGNKLGASGLLVVAAKYLFSDTRKDGEVRIPARHSGSIAAEVERRTDRFGLLGSLGVGRRWSDDALAMEWVGQWVAQIGAGVQVRVSDGTWVELRASVQIADGDDDSFVSLANFKWNFDVRPVKPK